jgi:hypothetical protein
VYWRSVTAYVRSGVIKTAVEGFVQRLILEVDNICRFMEHTHFPNITLSLGCNNLEHHNDDVYLGGGL